MYNLDTRLHFWNREKRRRGLRRLYSGDRVDDTSLACARARPSGRPETSNARLGVGRVESIGCYRVRLHSLRNWNRYFAVLPSAFERNCVIGRKVFGLCEGSSKLCTL